MAKCCVVAPEACDLDAHWRTHTANDLLGATFSYCDEHLLSVGLAKNIATQVEFITEEREPGERELSTLRELHGQAPYDSLGIGTDEDLAKTEAELAKLHELRKDPAFRARERRFWAGKPR